MSAKPSTTARTRLSILGFLVWGIPMAATVATIFAKAMGSASGYAVPTSIVRADLAKAGPRAASTERCAP